MSVEISDAYRIHRLETAVERLCKMMQENTRAFPNSRVELELIRQYIRGDLEPRTDANFVSRV